MAETTFTVRQFFSIDSELLPLGEVPTGTYIVTGSVSNMLINNNRTNLSEDVIPGVGSSGGAQGWWPGPLTTNAGYGIIVGAGDTIANTGADGRTSNVTCWGWDAGEDQPTNDAAFIALAGNVLSTTFANTGSAKTALRNAGYYYQYPAGYDGQSPNTGTGSD